VAEVFGFIIPLINPFRISESSIPCYTPSTLRRIEPGIALASDIISFSTDATPPH
jgi:hypothetical protein